MRPCAPPPPPPQIRQCSQLTFANLAQLDRSETVNTRCELNIPRITGSVLTGGKLFAEFRSTKDPAGYGWNYRKKT